MRKNWSSWKLSNIVLTIYCFNTVICESIEEKVLETDHKSQGSCYSDMTLNSCDRNVDLQSVHSHQISEVHNVPISVLIRPIPSILDEDKVLSLMETIKVSLMIVHRKPARKKQNYMIRYIKTERVFF